MIPNMFDYRGDQVVHLLLGLIYPNFPPAPSPSTPATLDLGPKSKICSRDFFALSNAFQNDMTWRGSAKNHRGDRFQGKRPWCRPGATHPNIPQQQVTPDNFIQFRQSIEKLFMFFSYTDGHTDGHTNSMQNKSPHCPIFYLSLLIK